MKARRDRSTLPLPNPTNIYLMITMQSTVTVVPGLTAAHLGDEAVLLDANSGRYYGLNELGARIFDLVRTPIQVSQVKSKLLEEYKVEEAELEADLLAFLRDMAQRNLIEVSVEHLEE